MSRFRWLSTLSEPLVRVLGQRSVETTRLQFSTLRLVDIRPTVPLVTTCRNLEYRTDRVRKNKKAFFLPTTMAVTNANAHLHINLLDHDDTVLGEMPMQQAKKIADQRELKLVILDESERPPKFKLMKGADLFKLQTATREKYRADVESGTVQSLKIKKEKEIDCNLGCEERDLAIKARNIEEWYKKGHPICIKIISKIANKKDKNISKLQDEFVGKIEKLVTFAKVKQVKRTEYQVTLKIDAPLKLKDVSEAKEKTTSPEVPKEANIEPKIDSDKKSQ